MLQLDDDKNNLLILWAIGDVARVTAFFDSLALAAHMAKHAGVVRPPNVISGRPEDSRIGPTNRHRRLPIGYSRCG